MSSRRSIERVIKGSGHHWVGDGFRVANMIPGSGNLRERLSPFLLMDYHSPYEYSPTTKPRGVGSHPHRGFETVTLAFQGAVAHHDSAGGGGVIRSGDVQWMTAASGILHKEYHEADWAKQGGTFQMMQLWVNLPAANKMDPPRYQPLTSGEMGLVDLPDSAGTIRIVAGEHAGVRGPAQTVTPIDLWDITVAPGATATVPFPANHNTALFVLDGSAVLNGADAATEELVIFGNDGTDITIATSGGVRLLALSGEPIDGPVVSYGPFVMNSEEQIVEAINDFNTGKFGVLV